MGQVARFVPREKNQVRKKKDPNELRLKRKKERGTGRRGAIRGLKRPPEQARPFKNYHVAV